LPFEVSLEKGERERRKRENGTKETEREKVPHTTLKLGSFKN
jgi:hypothetical protein